MYSKVKAKTGCDGCVYFDTWDVGDCSHRSECSDEYNEYIFVNKEDICSQKQEKQLTISSFVQQQ